MQIKLETQRCVMAPSLIRSVCRKSPREGGAVYSLFVGIVLLCCLPMMAIHLVTVVVSTRSFFFSVEFASLVNLDIYCMSSHRSLFPKRKLRKRFIRRGNENEKGSEARLRCDKWHTYLTPPKFYLLVAFTMKSFSPGTSQGSLKNGLKCILLLQSKCICFLSFFLLLREISRYLFSCPQDLSLYMNLSTFIVKTL